MVPESLLHYLAQQHSTHRRRSCPPVDRCPALSALREKLGVPRATPCTEQLRALTLIRDVLQALPPPECPT